MNRKIISKPPNYFYLCVFLNIFLHFFAPLFNLISFPFNLWGIPLLFLGGYFLLNSYFLFKKQNTSEKFIKSNYLVKNGLYKYSRNPMYLGVIIFLTGLFIFLENLLGVISPIFFFVIMNEMFIPYEEEKMEKEMGKEYLEYKKRVRRWI